MRRPACEARHREDSSQHSCRKAPRHPFRYQMVCFLTFTGSFVSLFMANHN